MSKKMLIDAAHPEETRVVVVNGNRIEEFDFEAAAKKPLKGNIYLAKVTRVEPSLQAAFVNFGGNRHGFLAFNEIHPDYYQIPVADRQRLIAQQRADEISAPDEEREAKSEAQDEDSAAGQAEAEVDNAEPGSAEDGEAPPIAAEGETSSPVSEFTNGAAETGNGGEEDRGEGAAELPEPPRGEIVEIATEAAPPVQTGGASDDIDDAFEEARGRRFQPQGRPYKIHEVIKRHQILLVQVVKEERGTKGAALTTYLSLAGRYCVLMPNTARGGGISRKITVQADRKRLKSAVNELEIPPGIGLIIRTAGANRTKAEIKRDYEYLLRVWENVRDLTLKSTAPALVYEEGNLIKRAIRDLYSKEIDAILVDGDEGYKDAKAFMRTLMPSHAKAVQPYKDRIPLFQRFQIESLLDQMFQPTVHLRSGGYIVINQTEALVSIDVNSGRATREHSIEDTALKTNLEAADEVARQLRLRDLAGLIVIDFIDMEEGRNNRAVEKRIKDALKSDRARIQVGRISSFGLLEMSRQRLRAGVLEGSTNRCPHCEGTGIVRSVESQALRALRSLEEEGLRDRTAVMTLRVPPTVALYILNYKRADILEIELRYATSAVIEADDTLAASGLVLERTETKEPGQVRPVAPVQAVRFEAGIEDDAEDEETLDEGDEDEGETAGEAPRSASASPATSEEGEDRSRRRRRRRRRGRRDEPEGETRAPQPQQTRDEPRQTASEQSDDDEDGEDEPETEGQPGQESAAGELNGAGDAERGARRRRRRGRRGGRRNRERGEPREGQQSEDGASPEGGLSFESQPGLISEAFEPEPVRAAAPQEGIGDEPEPVLAMPPAPAVEIARPEPEKVLPEKPQPSIQSFAPQLPQPEPNSAKAEQPEGPPRRGWWQRRFGG